MGKLRLALLSGGDSPEREVSINSGNQVFEALDKEKYDILRLDPKTDLLRLVEEQESIDVALLILHGPNGEDGTVQGLLDLLKIPYQGAGVLGSSLAMNKLTSKNLYLQAGIPVPSFLSCEKGDSVNFSYILDTLGLPLVVKPASAGSSVGMTIVRDKANLEPALEKAFSVDSTVLVESYIKGLELTCGVLGNRNLEALPIIEIIPGDGHDFFDYDAKYLPGRTQEICPARIDATIKDQVQELAIQAHQALFLKGYSRTDFILVQDELFVLETNTIPGMTETSLYPQAAAEAGYPFSSLLDRLIELAMDVKA